MTLGELNKDEQLALVALLKATVMADGHVSTEEVEELQTVVDELGAEHYQKLMDDVELRIKSEDELRAFLTTITRTDAQELIYGTVMEMAMSDSMHDGEADVLDWLADAWDVQITFDESELDS